MQCDGVKYGMKGFTSAENSSQSEIITSLK